MKISIIIPSKNEAKRIGYVLESWAKICEGLDYEIIVIDDSEDETPKIIEKFSKKYKNIRQIRGEKKGVGAARNLGLKYSSGEIVIWSDADGGPELLEEDYIKDCKEWINSVIDCFKNENADIIISDHKYYFTGNLIQDIETLRQFNPQSMMGECYRKKVLDNNLISEGVTVGEDVEIYIKALNKARNIVKTSKPKPVFASVRSIKDIYRRYIWYGKDIWVFLKYNKRQTYRITMPVLHTVSVLVVPLVVLNPMYVLPYITVTTIEYVRHKNKFKIAKKSKRLTAWFLIPFLVTFERVIYTVGIILGLKNLFQRCSR